MNKKEKLSRKELLEFCYQDRIDAYGSFCKMPTIKKINMDLLLKFTILLMNSIGFSQVSEIIFLDEINNRNMEDNLHCTEAHCKRDYSIMNLRELCREKHCKIGFIKPFFMLVWTWIYHCIEYMLIPILGKEAVMMRSSSFLINAYQNYLKDVHGQEKKQLFCMTDRTFFSAIACNDVYFFSSVIQHGIIFNVDYYGRGLANRFLAWGKRSKEIIKNRENVVVAGTYKFDDLYKIAKANKENTEKKTKQLLYCVSIIDMECVAQKIEKILIAIEKSEYFLCVKLHPGSLYNGKTLIEKYADKGVQFYKECLITDIEFDVAIIENSTILIDLVCMNKPFIVYDKKGGYFLPYSNNLIWVNDESNFLDAIEEAITKNCSQIRNDIIEQELNGGECSVCE